VIGTPSNQSLDANGISRLVIDNSECNAVRSGRVSSIDALVDLDYRAFLALSSPLMSESLMDVALEIAGAADTDLLIKFMREFYELDRLAFEEQSARSALQQILSDDSFGRVWLIQTNRTPIGYVVLTLGFSLEFHGRDAFVDEIYITPQYQGRGIGRKALGFVEEACRSLGVQALHLEVGRGNTNAQAVYRTLGFEDREQYLMTKWVAS